MAIKELITIEGAEEVKKTIADLGKSGEDFIKKLNGVGASNNAGLQSFFTGMKSGSSTLNEHARSVNEISATYHILNPLLREAGLGMIGFREWSMVARLGFAGLAAAGVGAVVTELFKLGEASVEAKQKLENVLGPSGGRDLFKGLQGAAASANTTVESLATGAKTLAQAWATTPVVTGWVREFNTQLDQYGNIIKEDLDGHLVPTGFTTIPKDMKDIPIVLAEISKGFQAEGMKSDDANKAAQQLLASLLKLNTVDLTKIPEMAGQISQGFTKGLDFQGLSLELVQQFEASAPLMAGALEDKLKGGFSSVKERIANEGKISADEFINAILAMQPKLDKATSAVPRTLGQITSDMIDSVSRGLTDLTIKLEETNTQGVKSIESTMIENKVPDIIKEQWRGIWQSVTDGATTAFEKIKSIFGQQINLNIQGSAGGASSGGGSFAEPPFASGGLFRGRGGTDNNVIRVSDYEYIMNPSAVRKYGVDFMHMINALQFPMRGFAAGGLVSPRISIPSSVAGSHSNKSVTFTWKPGGFGLSGNRSTIEALEREATLRGISAAGLAPGWVR